jgi:hypothetical protein
VRSDAGDGVSRHSTLNSLSLSLARQPDIVEFSRSLVQRQRDRLGRITGVFTFVSHLVDVPPALAEEPRDGVDCLLALAGEQEGPAVILAALLRALGERVHIECAPRIVFVRVELDLADTVRLAPFTSLMVAQDRVFIPLDPRRSRSPLGFLPEFARAWYGRRPVPRAFPSARALLSR